MAGVTVVTLMPELRDLDARQRDRGFEGDQTERRRKAPRQVGRQGRNTVGLRGNHGPATKLGTRSMTLAGAIAEDSARCAVRCAACPVSDPVTRM